MRTAEGTNAIAAAENAAEAVRTLNHATEFVLADVYRIQADLATLAERLPHPCRSSPAYSTAGRQSGH